MTELKYLIYQALINLNVTSVDAMPKREMIKAVKDFLDKERVEYDPETIGILVEMCFEKLNND